MILFHIHWVSQVPATRAVFTDVVRRERIVWHCLIISIGKIAQSDIYSYATIDAFSFFDVDYQVDFKMDHTEIAR